MKNLDGIAHKLCKLRGRIDIPLAMMDLEIRDVLNDLGVKIDPGTCKFYLELPSLSIRAEKGIFFWEAYMTAIIEMEDILRRKNIPFDRQANRRSFALVKTALLPWTSSMQRI